jgi:hypothetical protein
MDLRDLSVNAGSLTDNLVVVCVAPDPEPQHPAFDFDTKRPRREPNPHREETAHSLETQGRGLFFSNSKFLQTRTDRSR